MDLSHVDLSLRIQADAHKYLWETYPQLMGNDHYPIVIKDVRHQPQEIMQLPRYNFTKANWKKYQTEIKIMYLDEDPDNRCTQIKDDIKEAAGLCSNEKNKYKNNIRTRMWWTIMNVRRQLKPITK